MDRHLNKRQWTALGRVFEREITGLHILQSKARIYTDMALLGYVEPVTPRLEIRRPKG